MTTPHKALHDILTNDASVASIAGDRVYPRVLPQGSTFPAVRYFSVVTDPSDTKDGASIVDAVLVQIDCFAQDYDDAAELYDAVRAALDFVAPATYDGVKVGGCRFVDDDTDYDEQMMLHIKRLEMDFRIKE